MKHLLKHYRENVEYQYIKSGECRVLNKRLKSGDSSVLFKQTSEKWEVLFSKTI
jgi:hypothetical protein